MRLVGVRDGRDVLVAVCALTPPWLLRPGDVVEVEVERLGRLRTPITGLR